MLQRCDICCPIRLRRSVNLNRQQLPPRREAPSPRRDRHNQPLRTQPACKLHPQIIALVEVVADSIIQIERPFARRAERQSADTPAA